MIYGTWLATTPGNISLYWKCFVSLDFIFALFMEEMSDILDKVVSKPIYLILFIRRGKPFYQIMSKESVLVYILFFPVGIIFHYNGNEKLYRDKKCVGSNACICSLHQRGS